MGKDTFISLHKILALHFLLLTSCWTSELTIKYYRHSFQWLSYRTVCLMKRSGSWAVKVVSRDLAVRPSSSLMDLGLGLNSGLSLMSRIRTETVAVDWRGKWMPRDSATSFSASTVSMKERVSSKSTGWTEKGGINGQGLYLNSFFLVLATIQSTSH